VGGTSQDLAVSETDGTVSIELNFKAFADNVPTTQHAKRTSRLDDPSIQDFADQALELATLRAELKRLARDYEILQQQAAAREARFDDLRRELTAARMQLREERHAQSQTFAATIVEEASRMRPLLIPVDRPDSPVALSRDIVTIGRTSMFAPSSTTRAISAARRKGAPSIRPAARPTVQAFTFSRMPS